MKKLFLVLISSRLVLYFLEFSTQNQFSKELENIHFSDSKNFILSNSDPLPTKDGKLLKEKFLKQMTTGVRWREIMNILIDRNISTLVEIGPGNVLSGLAKRSMQGVGTNQISNKSDLGY